MFKKNCRIPYRITNALVEAVNFLPKVKKEGAEGSKTF